MDIGVVGNEHFVAGFELAGVRKTYVAGDQVTETFMQASQDPDVGILIMDADEYEKMDDRAKDQALTQVKPTVVLLSHDESGEESLRMMIMRALGIDLWSKND